MKEQQDDIYINVDIGTIKDIAKQRLLRCVLLENENNELRKTLAEVPNIIQDKEIHIQALLNLVKVYRKNATFMQVWEYDNVQEAEKEYEKAIKR